MQIMIDLALMLAVAVMAGLFGWLLTGGRRAAGTATGSPGDVNRAREALGQLHELATKVAFDVGQHHTRVEAINEELAASKGQDSQSVTAAVRKLMEANHQLQQRLATAEVRIQTQAWLVESHAAQARTDALTGLNNRRAFDDALQSGLDAHRKSRQPMSVVMIDIDFFKKFNDTYGHQAGDEVLHRVGGILRETLGPLGFVARYGGEEFSAILKESQLEGIAKALETLRRTVQDYQFRYDGATLRVTISIGAATIQGDEDGPGLVRRADEALYASKKAGRNCAHWHDGEKTIPITPAEEPEAPPAAQPQPSAEHDVAPPAAAPETDVALPAAERPDAAAESEAAARGGLPRDPQLRNRTAFCVSLGSQMADWRCGGAPPSVVLLRIDRLQKLQSELGGEAVSELIRGVSEALVSTVRRLDLLAYYAQGTFAVLLPGTPVARAALTADRLRYRVANGAIRAGEKSVPATLSAGIAEAVDSDNLERILLRASEALAAAERRGGDCVSYHNGIQSESADLLIAAGAASKEEAKAAAGLQTSGAPAGVAS